MPVGFGLVKPYSRILQRGLNSLEMARLATDILCLCVYGHKSPEEHSSEGQTNIPSAHFEHTLGMAVSRHGILGILQGLLAKSSVVPARDSITSLTHNTRVLVFMPWYIYAY